MKILVTGSSGYIGQHLCHYLSESYGFSITGLDTVNRKTYAENFIQQDIMSMECLKEHYDVVVHLAALVNVGDSVKYPMRYYQTNVTGTLNVL
jgi:nucleoside-diphosphate-sugar epimerase